MITKKNNLETRTIEQLRRIATKKDLSATKKDLSANLLISMYETIVFVERSKVSYEVRVQKARDSLTKYIRYRCGVEK